MLALFFFLTVMIALLILIIGKFIWMQVYTISCVV